MVLGAEGETVTEKYKGFTLTELQSVLAYDPETGWFTWLVDVSSKAMAGYRAGYQPKDGHYRRIVYKGKVFNEHRLAWWFAHGWLPKAIDHRNRDKTDTRLANLRPASPSQNAANTTHRSGVLGMKGVHLCRCTGRYRAQIKKDYKKVHLGRFDTPEEAHAAYSKAAMELFGEFASV